MDFSGSSKCISLQLHGGRAVFWCEVQPQDDCPTHLQVPGRSPNLEIILTTDCAQFSDEIQKQVPSYNPDWVNLNLNFLQI